MLGPIYLFWAGNGHYVPITKLISCIIRSKSVSGQHQHVSGHHQTHLGHANGQSERNRSRQRIVLPTLAYLMSSEMLNQLNVITLWLITKLNCITLLTLLESIIYISCVYFQVYSNTLLKKPNLHSKIIVYIVKYWWSCSQRF